MSDPLESPDNIHAFSTLLVQSGDPLSALTVTGLFDALALCVVLSDSEHKFCEVTHLGEDEFALPLDKTFSLMVVIGAAGGGIEKTRLVVFENRYGDAEKVLDAVQLNHLGNEQGCYQVTGTTIVSAEVTEDIARLRRFEKACIPLFQTFRPAF